MSGAFIRLPWSEARQSSTFSAERRRFSNYGVKQTHSYINQTVPEKIF
jgi:hypothetical protein